jgi:hypothetical protein
MACFSVHALSMSDSHTHSLTLYSQTHTLHSLATTPAVKHVRKQAKRRDSIDVSSLPAVGHLLECACEKVLKVHNIVLRARTRRFLIFAFLFFSFFSFLRVCYRAAMVEGDGQNRGCATRCSLLSTSVLTFTFTFTYLFIFILLFRFIGRRLVEGDGQNRGRATRRPGATCIPRRRRRRRARRGA